MNDIKIYISDSRISKYYYIVIPDINSTYQIRYVINYGVIDCINLNPINHWWYGLMQLITVKDFCEGIKNAKLIDMDYSHRLEDVFRILNVNDVGT